MALACQVSNEIIEIRIAQLGLAKRRHHGDAMSHDESDVVRREIRAVREQCGLLALVLGA